MKLLKQVGPKCNTVEEAEDALAGISVLPWFVFGYVNEKENRCVSFHEVDYNPGDKLCAGQRIVECQVGAK